MTLQMSARPSGDQRDRSRRSPPRAGPLASRSFALAAGADDPDVLVHACQPEGKCTKATRLPSGDHAGA